MFMNHIAVGIGEVLWDMLPAGRKIGGAPANFAYHTSQFGIDGYAVSAVGQDILGDEAIEILGQQGVKCLIRKVNYPTGTVKITLNNQGIPQYDIEESAAWDNIPFDNELKRLALRTRLVCFGSLAQRNPVSCDTICRFIDTMPDTDDTLKVFDINLRLNFYTKELLHASLVRCNVLKINDEELEIVGRLFDLPTIGQSERCRLLLERYALKMVVLTCGIAGSHIITPESDFFRQTPKVIIADTVGAGDSFSASFCAALLYGKSIPEAHQLAIEVSAYVCTQHGPMPSLPSELKKAIID